MVVSCMLKTRAGREMLLTFLKSATPKHTRPVIQLQTPKSVFPILIVAMIFLVKY